MKEKLIADAGISLFQPDSLLPSQFFVALKHKAHACGEHRLMLAILEDAVDCFQKYMWATDSRSRHLGTEAEKWFLSEDDSWPFSFVNICHALDLHPEFLRRGLLEWKARQLARHQSKLRYSGTVPVLTQPDERSSPAEPPSARRAEPEGL
ncbi:MAG TPA: hypothetical protein VKK81_00410 [Candidatus Binatia bacterium]|nr:hypothetical protein [Candidatus Binatia bacterium]